MNTLYNYRTGELNSKIANALDSLDGSAGDEHARSYMDGGPENMTAGDAAALIEWLDENDPRAASAVRSTIGG